MFAFDLDHMNEILRCRTRGFWSIDDATQFVEAFRKASLEGRSRFGHLKILIDARDMAIQDPKVHNCFIGLDSELLRCPEDRFAILVSSSLQKIQAQSALSTDCSKIFISETAALTWLLAFVMDADRRGPLYRSPAAGDPGSHLLQHRG